ncbi:hypothetical protein [Caballeronia sp. NCTM1]|jgi:hypothetical protein|uniref:hypothetical protein n=1 Tax=Caballeronia sp. NCTM1 TaxID=2921753 RepID=UPI0020280580|nr:hypothetical protein [Caballeronia sp. NCTM1]
MTSHEQYLIAEATNAYTKLREVCQSGNITIESAAPIGQAIAMLQLLSRALESRHEHAV